MLLYPFIILIFSSEPKMNWVSKYWVINLTSANVSAHIDNSNS